jgi:putative hydrolase of the HAD superfamily
MKHEFFEVRHISFDVWLTLIRSNPQFKKERDALVKEFFALPQPVELISDHFRQWDKRFTAINEITGKNLDAEEMLAIIISGLDHDLKNVGPAEFEKFLNHQEHLFTQYHPELIESGLADYLQRYADQGITFSIMSNTGFIKGRLLRALLDHLNVGKHFSFQLYSDEICCSKPSEEAFGAVFKHACSTRSLEKRHILHIGDNAHADGFGAERAGMQNALINSNNVSLLSLNIYSKPAHS